MEAQIKTKKEQICIKVEKAKIATEELKHLLVESQAQSLAQAQTLLQSQTQSTS
jgi:hypothetical protein